MRFSKALVALLGCSACARSARVEKVELDTYRIICEDTPLDQCLRQTADNACDKRAYAVLRGISDVNRRGRSEAPDVQLSSEAIVRCGPDGGWRDQAKVLMSEVGASALAAPPPSAAVVAPKPPAPVCAPGATQACVGPAGCTGGQACKADGTGYEPCDCGPAVAPPAPPAVAPS